MRLSIFKGWTDETPVSISLDAIVEMMRTDASLKDLTEKHRYYLSIGQKSNAKYYKQRMPCFAVAVRFEGGKAKDNIAALTGLTIVDIDDIPSHEMTRVLDLIRKDPHTLLSYTTISGNGIRVITRYAFNVNDNDNDNKNDDDNDNEDDNDDENDNENEDEPSRVGVGVIVIQRIVPSSQRLLHRAHGSEERPVMQECYATVGNSIR